MQTPQFRSVGTSSDCWVLGLGGSSHDFSASLTLNSDVRVAIEEERLSRKRHGLTWWYQNPVMRSVNYCLQAENIGMADVAAVVSSDLLPWRAAQDFEKSKLRLYPHHKCHAASTLPFIDPAKSAAIIVYDGMGSVRASEGARTRRETFSFYLAEGGELTCIGETFGEGWLESTDFTMGTSNSMGNLYEIATLAMFGPYEEGKTMGLAAHGQPIYIGDLLATIELKRDVNNCFVCDPIKSDTAAWIEKTLAANRYSFEARANIAASFQLLLERVLLHCWSLVEKEKPATVALAGGCALNSVANGVLARALPESTSLIIPPFAGDSGLCIGATELWLRETSYAPKRLTFRRAPPAPGLSRPGRTYSARECEIAVQQAYPALSRDDAVKTPKDLAHLLAEGRVLAMFRGGSEIGPRALGTRSILADPRAAATRERINRLIKHREPFRPIAPMVLAERFDDYFSDPECADEYMLKVARLWPEKTASLAAVSHIDGTARVQIVTKIGDAFLYELISEFALLTGIAVIVNTSFNRRGEPIVETPRDAVDSFLGMALDGLFLEGTYYVRAQSTLPSATSPSATN